MHRGKCRIAISIWKDYRIMQDGKIKGDSTAWNLVIA